MKKQKLNLFHLAAYFPYNVKARFPKTNNPRCREYVIGEVHVIYSNCTIVCHDTVNASPDKFKLLLYPMSDLTDRIIKLLNPNNDFAWEAKQLLYDKTFCECHFSTIKTLLKSHFDIYNLIPRGLALDINNYPAA